MSRSAKAIIDHISLGKSKVQQKPEVLFVVTTVEGITMFHRDSLSDKEISSGPNEGRTMCQVTLERYRRALELDESATPAEIISGLQKFKGEEVTVVIGSYTDPDTQVITPEIESLMLPGVGGMAVDAFVASLNI